MHQFQEQLLCRSITKTENEDKNENVSEVPPGVKKSIQVLKGKTLVKYLSLYLFLAETHVHKDIERENLIMTKLLSFTGLKART